MTTINPMLGRWLAGCGGVLLIAALFIPWSGAGGVSSSGWDALSLTDILFAITGVCGVIAAITGGRFGFFRRDLSWNGMTDILGVISGFLIGWLLVFDFPAGASPEIGVYLALAGAVAVATGAGDFRVTSWFPAMADTEHPPGRP